MNVLLHSTVTNKEKSQEEALNQLEMDIWDTLPDDKVPVPPLPDGLLQREKEIAARTQRERALKSLSEITWKRKEEDCDCYLKHDEWRRRMVRAGKLRWVGEDSNGLDIYEAVPSRRY